jgi:hypothetical protein
MNNTTNALEQLSLANLLSVEDVRRHVWEKGRCSLAHLLRCWKRSVLIATPPGEELLPIYLNAEDYDLLIRVAEIVGLSDVESIHPEPKP